VKVTLTERERNISHPTHISSWMNYSAVVHLWQAKINRTYNKCSKGCHLSCSTKWMGERKKFPELAIAFCETCSSDISDPIYISYKQTSEQGYDYQR
jgi:hypothetical protein